MQINKWFYRYLAAFVVFAAGLGLSIYLDPQAIEQVLMQFNGIQSTLYCGAIYSGLSLFVIFIVKVIRWV